MKRIGLVLLGTCLILGACSDSKKLAPKEGRITVISEEKIAQSGEKVRLNKTSAINEWNTLNANPQNRIPAVSLEKATPDWKAKSAKGRDNGDLPLTTPVITGETIYILDNRSNIIAKNIKDGQELWRENLDTESQGVGLTANKNSIATLDENGNVAMFNNKGELQWKKEFKTPFRNSPLLINNTLYLLSSSNDLWVLDAKTGKEKWHYKTTESQTLLQGMGSPAIANDVIIVPFSTGEIVGFGATTGTLLWSQDLVGEKVFNAIAQLSQMTASPVIENGIVYLVGHSGKTLAVNLKTGESLWKIPRGGQNTPLVNGNALFFLDNHNHLLAINKKSGKFFWDVELENALWKGPFFVDGNLVLFSEEKTAVVNPSDGKVTIKEKGIKGSNPVIISDGIFFLGDNGYLYHWEKI
ncbi:MAG: PQQ-binding-like beta-propeller repeat protein [Alphaproteobacteria bacterium]|nr:PQQ-binding-like beta-propeller repeat protein [Alphaproteobacteria bacterium]